MALFTVGLNHTTAPVELREQVAIDVVRLPNALVQLTEQFPGVRERFYQHVTGQNFFWQLTTP